MNNKKINYYSFTHVLIPLSLFTCKQKKGAGNLLAVIAGQKNLESRSPSWVSVFTFSI